MPSIAFRRRFAALLLVPALWLGAGSCCRAQAALLLEGADGISAFFDPTGHAAVYFARICAASPTRLRRCAPGEQGAVIARYKGIAGYDWLATPLLPYLYSVDDPSAVPSRADLSTVDRLRRQYHDEHLLDLPASVPEGGRIQRGWNQLVGAAYERRIYAFRFATTEEQDNAFIARMNDLANQSHFNILFSNCANFAADVLNFYLPHDFSRRAPSDGGMVTPRQIAWELVSYGRSNPDIELETLEIPQVPGYRRPSRTNQSVAASLLETGYIAPIAALNPFAAAAIVADFLLWGRDPLPLAQAQVLAPEDLSALTSASPAAGNLLLSADHDSDDRDSDQFP
jgi:hypothetical protein